MIEFPFDTEKLFEKFVKHKYFPKNDFQKLPILQRILEDFKDNKQYSEQEVNEIIKKYCDDFALIRRELINFGYMQRDPYKSLYWVVKRELSKEDMENNTLLKRAAKEYLK